MANYKEWLEKEVEAFKKREAEGETIDPQDPMLKYIYLCVDKAAELAELLSKQDHSGMSAGVTLGLFKKLASWEPLTPLLGTDSEWGDGDDYNKEYISKQNQRNFGVFKRLYPDGHIEYSYNDLLSIVNEDGVWLNLTPKGQSGYIDDDADDVKVYLEKLKKLKGELRKTIVFPYVPKTYKYIYDLDKQEFVKQD